MSRILVVANQTLGGEALLAAVQSRVDAGPQHVTLLVPATRRAHWTNTEMMGHLATSLPPHPSAAAAAGEDDYARARRRLEYGLGELRRTGAQVEGVVGDDDAFKAIEQALARDSYDEIILSTLPSGKSRWLRQALADRVRRITPVPVTVITASSAHA
jgi:hypothetical protein